MQKKLEHFITSGIIWRIIEHTQNPNIILIEIREQVLWQTKFIMLNINDNIYTEFVLSESWWINPVFFDNQYIYFYFYANSEKPIPTELWTFDYTKNEIIQKTNEINIDFLTIQKPIKKEIFETNYYQENEEYFDTLNKFIQLKTKKIDVIKNIAYIEINDFLVIDYFTKENDIYTENLWITDKKGNIIIEKTFEVPENFFIGERIYILENKLIFIQQKTKIYVYE